MGDCRMAAPIQILLGASRPRNWTRSRLDFVSVSDERGSVINDYLYVTLVAFF